MKDNKLIQRITEELETIDEAYERARFESLTPEEQRLLLLHHVDQFEAVPSYVQRKQGGQQ